MAALLGNEDGLVSFAGRAEGRVIVAANGSRVICFVRPGERLSVWGRVELRLAGGVARVSGALMTAETGAVVLHAPLSHAAASVCCEKDAAAGSWKKVARRGSAGACAGQAVGGGMCGVFVAAGRRQCGRLWTALSR